MHARGSTLKLAARYRAAMPGPGLPSLPGLLESLPVEEAAKRLLGCELWRQLPDGRYLGGCIVETEAYDQTDAASHSYKGRTPRTEVMFGPPGYLYVYFTYGMHHCCNVVTGPAGYGAAVLVRAMEPLAGVEYMAANRNGASGRNLTNGPAKLCQAFRIDKSLNGHELAQLPLRLQECPPLPAQDIVTATRIGITRAAEVPWRFYVRGSPYVSKS